jgi:hypothetical protein
MRENHINRLVLGVRYVLFPPRAAELPVRRLCQRCFSRITHHVSRFTFHVSRFTRLLSPLALCLLIWLPVLPTHACRYNVRDLGFVDGTNDFYTLYGVVRQDTPGETVGQFTQAAQAAFQDANVRFEVINVDRQKEHAALQYVAKWSLAAFPALVLVSPDGHSLPVPIPEAGSSFAASLTAALKEIVSSPKRTELIQQAVQAYGVVLLIEGAEAQANQQARRAINQAIAAITADMRNLPKPIVRPPVMVSLAPELYAPEKLLLWSLGLNTEPTNSPRAAVIYGKARWIGPLMRGPEISEANLTGILAVVGADCECGMDIAWTRGTRLPGQWGEALHAQATKSLGFDAEDPLVKLEAERILGRQMAASGDPSGYKEVALPTLAGPSPGQTLSTGPATNAASLRASSRKTSLNPALAENGFVLGRLAWTLGAMALLAIAAAGLILWRTSRRR